VAPCACTLPFPPSTHSLTRPWYRRAVVCALQEGCSLAVSTPYTDASGAGTVLTLSQPILVGGTGPANVVAVLGVDFTMAHFAGERPKCAHALGSQISGSVHLWLHAVLVHRVLACSFPVVRVADLVRTATNGRCTPNSDRCFVVDSGGFIVWHKDLAGASSSPLVQDWYPSVRVIPVEDMSLR
jgi:hypothetical protein